jgi:membrane protein YqaA with SNARE-associated domain
MNLWLLIIGALTLQEGLSTTVILLDAVHAHYPLLLIHAIWLFVTVLQIVAGYFLGKWIQKRFGNSKAEQWFKKSAGKLEKSIGKQGAELALVIASALVSPAATSFLASWLDLSLTKIFIFTLLGDFLWYLSEWVTVYGATQILSDVKYGFVVLFVIAVAYIAASRLRKSQN